MVGKFQAGGDSAKEAMSQISEALKNCDDESLQYTAGVGLMGTMWEDMGADACTSLMNVEGDVYKRQTTAQTETAQRLQCCVTSRERTERATATSITAWLTEKPLCSMCAVVLQSRQSTGQTQQARPRT